MRFLDDSGDAEIDSKELGAVSLAIYNIRFTLRAFTFLPLHAAPRAPPHPLHCTDLQAIKLYQEKRDEGSLDEWATAGNVEVDKVFPNWMIARDDFKLVFTRFNGPASTALSTAAAQNGSNKAIEEGESAPLDSIGAALGVTGQSRSHEDLQMLAQWLKEHSKVI